MANLSKKGVYTYSCMNVGMKPGHVGDGLSTITIESDRGSELYPFKNNRFKQHTKPLKYI
jgi:hypothetical protein